MTTLEEAHSLERSRAFFSYKADPPPNIPPISSGLSQADWSSLSPGMQREIARYAIQVEQRNGEGSLPPRRKTPAGETRRDRKNRREEVERLGRKRL